MCLPLPLRRHVHRLPVANNSRKTHNPAAMNYLFLFIVLLLNEMSYAVDNVVLCTVQSTS